jgi:hypothetical protein
MPEPDFFGDNACGLGEVGTSVRGAEVGPSHEMLNGNNHSFLRELDRSETSLLCVVGPD